MHWTGWSPIDDSCPHAGPAVYEIRLVDPASGPAQLNRFLGTDPSGILCIGETGELERRRKQFVAAWRKGGKHSEGNLLHLLEAHSPFLRFFPSPRLEMRYAAVSTKEEAKGQEEKRLKAYVKIYGEVPPLNSSIPDRDGNWGIS